MTKVFIIPATLLLVFLGWACTDRHNLTSPALPAVRLQNRSVTPALVNVLPGAAGGRLAANAIHIYSLISSDDQLEQSPNFVFAGSADGSGLLKNPDETFTLLVNHENNFAVSRVTFDKTFKPVKGEYVLNSDGGTWRLCSATMVTPEEHGFGPLYLTSGESGEESRTHGLNPRADVSGAGVSK